MDQWMNLSESRLLELVPDRAGLYFVGCPNCTGGYQENQLRDWRPDEPDVVRCTYCGMAYPNDIYKDDKTEEVLSPGGDIISYPYYENKEGYRYYFTASREYNKRAFCEALILKLAQRWKETKNTEYARKAALMLHRFAVVWPRYCWHFDYPFIQKQWYQGYVDPKDCRQDYRTARYHWWGFTDLKLDLLSAYEILKDGDFWQDLDKEMNEDVRGKIEWFFRDNADHLIAQKTGLGNMHPYLWRTIVKLGRILKDVKYIHYPIPDIKKLIKEGFFADGAWCEGSPDYTAQTLNGILEVCDYYDGWIDPPSYVPGESDLFLDGTSLRDLCPEIKGIVDTLEKQKFPYGGRLTCHDSWGHAKYPYPKVPNDHKEESFLLPVLGHGCLTGGIGESTGRVDLTFRGGYGHQHMDGLSIMVTAYGREMLSDIGYTHTKYRCLTLATLAHNTVVVDCKNQHSGHKHVVDGNLRFYDDRNPVFQILSVDNPQVYPGLTEEYRRTIARIQTNSKNFYLTDLFFVKGGKQHDYILHGDCIAEQEPVMEDPSYDRYVKLDTLLPEGTEFAPPTGEHQVFHCARKGYIYGLLSNIKEASPSESGQVKWNFSYTGLPVGPKDEKEKFLPDEREKQLGIRIRSFTEDTDRLYTGFSSSVRQGNNDDDALERYLRPFVMVRRFPGEEGSVFCSVMEPYDGEAKINTIRKVYQEGDSVILKIQGDSFSDYVFFNIRKDYSLPTDDASYVTVNGLYGFLRMKDGKPSDVSVSCGTIRFNDTVIATEPFVACPFERVESGYEESKITVYDPKGLMNPEKNETVLIRRKDRTFGYKVKAWNRKGEFTEIVLDGSLGFVFDPVKGQSMDQCFPLRTYDGIHEVIRRPVVHQSFK